MAQLEKLGLLSCSAALAALSFIYPSYFAFLSCVYLIPLLYVLQKTGATLWHGFFWGIIFFSLQHLGLIELVWNKGHGHFRLLAIAMLILWSSFHAGLWFLAVKMSFSISSNSLYKTASATTATFLFYVYMGSFVFWPLLGVPIGNCLGSPLLPLAQYSVFIYGLSIFGQNILLFCLILAQYALLNYVMQKGRAWLFITGMCMAPFIFGFFKVGRSAPNWIERIGYIMPPAQTIEHPLERGAAINRAMQQAVIDRPNVHTFLMPESTCQFCLNEYPEIIELWKINAGKNKTLLVGSPRADQQKRFNSLYKIEGGRITKYYDKSLLMPLTEYIPNNLKKFFNTKELFLNNKKEFSTSVNSPHFLEIDAQLTVIPKLCSELFFYPYNEAADLATYPILFAVNDSWFAMDYLKHLMLLFAIFQSVLLQKEIIYVCHTSAIWIDGYVGHHITL